MSLSSLDLGLLSSGGAVLPEAGASGYGLRRSGTDRPTADVRERVPTDLQLVTYAASC
jgi:hypothetical protein